MVGAAFAVLAFSLINKTSVSVLFNQDLSFLSPIGIKDLSSLRDLFAEFRSKISVDKAKGRVAIFSGGETTVIMSECDSPGKGGRSQEMTLGFEFTFMNLMRNYEKNELSFEGDKFDLAFSSFGTDGIDGPTDAAGAYFVYERDELNNGYNVEAMREHLLRHDSYNYFGKLNRLIKIGATGSNVSDLQILLLNF